MCIMKKILALIVVLFGFFWAISFAQDYIFFYGNWCPHCENVEKFFEKNDVYKKFDIQRKEIYFNRENLKDLNFYLDKLKISSDQIGIPFLVIDSWSDCSYLNWDQPIIDFFQKKIDSLSVVCEHWESCDQVSCTHQECTNAICDKQVPWKVSNWSWWVSSNIFSPEIKEKLSFFAIMLPAAISDSINPCAFAVMLLLLSAILSKHKSRKKTLLAWWMFALAVFLSYLAMGIWLFSALAWSSNTFVLKLVVWILWILVWLANLKDFFWYGKLFVMEVPFSRRPKMANMIDKVTSPWWAFAVGLLVSLFLLPCSSGPYFTILWYLSSESKSLTNRGYIYLIVYNLLFVLPMVIIAGLVWFGYSTVDKLAKIKHQNTKLIHLIVGLLMLGLGIYVLTTI